MGPMGWLLWAVSGWASTLPDPRTRRSSEGMTEQALEAALTRAERALARCERAAGDAVHRGEGDQALRTKVREAIAELDQLIQQAEA